MAAFWCRACDVRFDGSRATCPSCGQDARVQRIARPPAAGWRRAAGGFVVGAGLAGLLTLPGRLFGVDVSDPIVRLAVCAAAGLGFALVARRGGSSGVAQPPGDD